MHTQLREREEEKQNTHHRALPCYNPLIPALQDLEYNACTCPACCQASWARGSNTGLHVTSSSAVQDTTVVPQRLDHSIILIKYRTRVTISLGHKQIPFKEKKIYATMSEQKNIFNNLICQQDELAIVKSLTLEKTFTVTSLLSPHLLGHEDYLIPSSPIAGLILSFKINYNLPP